MVRSAKRSKIDVKEVVLDTDEDFMAVIDGLTYNGLDLKKIRRIISSKNLGIDEICSDVVSILMAYMMVGNNTRKLTDKITDKNIGESVKHKLRLYDIRQKPSNSETLTLPRIAIAFLPAYYLLRTFAENKLQRQTSSSIDLRFMDIVFCGVPQIWKKDGYSTFYAEFSKLIEDRSREADEVNEMMVNSDGLTDDQMIWVDIATNGYNSDVEVKSIMEKVMALRRDEITSYMIKKTISDILDTVTEDEAEDEEQMSQIVDKRASGRKGKKTYEQMEEGEIE